MTKNTGRYEAPEPMEPDVPREKGRRGLRRMLQAFGLLSAFGVLLAGAASAVLWEVARNSPAPPLLDGVAFSTEILSAEGDLLRLTPAADGIWRIRTRLAEMDPKLVEATLFYEDRAFLMHPGINPLALLRAGIGALRGGRRMGASTLTMQLARLRLGLRTDTPGGKLRQMWHALRYEAHYSKAEILEAYLNLAPYGGNVEGAGAAARIWFGRRAGRLTASEATMLAVIPQNPVRRRPSAGGNPGLDDARERLFLAMIEADRLPRRLQGAARAPVVVKDASMLPFRAPHFTDMTLARLKTEGRPDAPAGSPVRTTLRLPLQGALESLVRDTVGRLRVRGVRNAAVAVADARDRSLLALVGSADWHDASIAGEVNAWNALRSPGSTLKPFVYGLALDQGLIHEKTVLVDRPQSFGGWSPENADGTFAGPLTAEDALVRSRNLPAADLERRLNPGLWSLLRRADVPLAHDARWYGLSIVLGGAEVRMADLMKLYCALADDALLKPIRWIEGEASTASTPLFSPEAAFVVRRMLASRETFVNAAGARRELLYKTGTSNGWRDAWAAGSVGPYVIVVWLGDFSGAPSPLLQGARVAAPLLRAAAERIAADASLTWPRPETPQEEAARRHLRASLEPVCRATGDLDTTLCRETTPAWMLPGRTSVRDSGVFRRVLIRESTGLRACRPGPGVKTIVWESWPTHFQQVFLEAGIIKRPPPPFEAGCDRASGFEGGAVSAPGTPPEIQSPRAGATLLVPRGSASVKTLLQAGTDADAGLVYWHDGARFIGASRSGSPLEWRVESGTHLLTATDERGRSTSIRFRVKR